MTLCHSTRVLLQLTVNHDFFSSLVCEEKLTLFFLKQTNHFSISYLYTMKRTKGNKMACLTLYLFITTLSISTYILDRRAYMDRQQEQATACRVRTNILHRVGTDDP